MPASRVESQSSVGSHLPATGAKLQAHCRASLQWHTILLNDMAARPDHQRSRQKACNRMNCCRPLLFQVALNSRGERFRASDDQAFFQPSGMVTPLGVTRIPSRTYSSGFVMSALVSPPGVSVTLFPMRQFLSMIAFSITQLSPIPI